MSDVSFQQLLFILTDQISFSSMATVDSAYGPPWEKDYKENYSALKSHEGARIKGTIIKIPVSERARY